MASVAERQHQAFAPLLQAARSGRPRRDFAVAADAVASTGMSHPLIVEVGCGSGYYSELLPLLSGRPVRYIGLDYAISMVNLAHQVYPAESFAAGDACRLPLAANSCDILLSGTSLMHISSYQEAIAESVRVTREWCIFHTVPVRQQGATTFLSKKAYGEPVTEVIINQAELEMLFSTYHLTIVKTLESIPYDLSAVIGEKTLTLTYLCQKVR